MNSRLSNASPLTRRTAGPRLRSLLAASAMALVLLGCHHDAPAGDAPAAGAPQRPVPDRLGAIALAPSADYPYLVAGQVFNPYTGVVTDAVAYFYVEARRGLRTGNVTTDANGQFTIYAPESTITVRVDKPGFVQQCVVQTAVGGDVALQVELTTTGTLMTTNAPRPQSVNGLSVAGSVFEVMNGVRTPIAGAAFWLEYYDDLGVATTQSDLDGRFFLCNVTQRAALHVSKLGYQSATLAIDALQTAPLEVELRLR
jgi:hypothetical protein